MRTWWLDGVVELSTTKVHSDDVQIILASDLQSPELVKAVAMSVCRFTWELEEGIEYKDDEFTAGWDSLDADQREVYYIEAQRILTIIREG